MKPESLQAIFRKALPTQIMLREVVSMMGQLDGKVCLDIGLRNGVASQALRNHGGEWHTAVRTAEELSSTEAITGSNVKVFTPPVLPYEDKTFDYVVVSDFLERIEEDEQLIAECHRVTKPTGYIITEVRHRKPVSLARLLESTLGLTPERLKLARNGYSEFELFALLKDGFDVHEVKSYAGLFTHLVDLVVQSKSIDLPADEKENGLVHLYSRAYPLYWFCFQILDLLTILVKGYHLIALGKRHAWHNREAPIIADGRTFTDTVLDKLGG